MARKARQFFAEETTSSETISSSEYMASSATEIVDNSAELVDPAPIMPSAVDRDGATEIVVAPPPKYRVVRDALVMSHGHRTWLRTGKVIDTSNYDMGSLLSQGVQLVFVEG